MHIVRWLVKKLRRRVIPSDTKTNLEDVIVAYDDVDLILYRNPKKQSKGL